MMIDAAVLAKMETRLAKRQAELLAIIRDHMLTNGQTGLFDKISQYEAAGDYRVADLAEDIEVNVVQRELTMLDEIMAARKRIKDGTYGICAECGEPVSERRLAVFPEALRCHSCQSITEVISDKLTRGNVGANRYL